MKRREFTQIKELSIKELVDKAKQLKKEIADLIIDQNMKKLKDTKAVFKKRKYLAKVLTILKQKQLLKQLESEKKVRAGQSSNVSKVKEGGRRGLSK